MVLSIQAWSKIVKLLNFFLLTIQLMHVNFLEFTVIVCLIILQGSSKSSKLEGHSKASVFFECLFIACFICFFACIFLSCFRILSLGWHQALNFIFLTSYIKSKPFSPSVFFMGYDLLFLFNL